MTDEQRAEYVAALLNERGGYERRLDDARKSAAGGEVERMDGKIAAVDAELARVRDESGPGAAAKRTRRKG